ncbi:hypothetical protein GCM10018790_35760 [Kitasatospora xanthocidica]|nr:hypothetical protein GCM10018790_35760 [Kitasatospora xanthocidica]
MRPAGTCPAQILTITTTTSGWLGSPAPLVPGPIISGKPLVARGTAGLLPGVAGGRAGGVPEGLG